MPFISGEATITIAYLVDSVNRFFPISRNSGNSTRNIMFFYYSDERDFLAPSASVFRPPLPRIFVPLRSPFLHSRFLIPAFAYLPVPAPSRLPVSAPLLLAFRSLRPLSRPRTDSSPPWHPVRRLTPATSSPVRSGETITLVPSSPARPLSVLASGKTHRSDKANGRQTVSDPAVPRLLRLSLIAHGFFLLISGTSVRPKI